MSETTSVREAARLLGVHENTVRNWMTQGLLPHQTLPGSGFRRPYLADVLRLVRGMKA